MNLDSWLDLITAGVGALVAGYGAVVLLTGWAAAGDRRAFRRQTDTGLYYICFGSALALLTLGRVWNRQERPVLTVAALALTVALVDLGVFRYRPRRRR